MLLEKIKELSKFDKFLFKVGEHKIIVGFKPLNYKQNEFLINHCQEIFELEPSAVLSFFTDLTNEEIEIFVSSEEALKRFYELLLYRRNLIYSPQDLILEALQENEQNQNNLINIFLMILLKHGYRLIELENKTEVEIIKLAIHEQSLRDPKLLFEILNQALADLKGLEELQRFVIEKISEVKKSSNEPSDYDKLANL